MILKSLPLKTSAKRATKLVNVPQWGEGAQVMLTELTIAGMVRESNMRQAVMDRKLNLQATTSLLMCVSLMSVMVDPDTGEFLLHETDLDNFANSVNGETMSALVMANAELNPLPEIVPLAKGETQLSAKKKKSSATG